MSEKPADPVARPGNGNGHNGKPRMPHPAVDRQKGEEKKDLAPGTVLEGRYTILKKIGEGGMGSVYLAMNDAIGKKVVVKVLITEEFNRQVFRREVMSAAKIGHENIINLMDFGMTPDGNPFIVMEHLEGKDLCDIIRKDGPMSWREARRILVQVCNALAALHEKGIVHRDVKPDNIFIIERDGSRVAKLLDFGIAKLADDGRHSDGFTGGTPEYTAPEQAAGLRGCDHRVDIYALGVVMYEMLCGALPFTSSAEKTKLRVLELMDKHQDEKPPPFSEKRPDLKIPADVEAVVMRALQKIPDDRFQSMKEMKEAMLLASPSGSGKILIPPIDIQTRVAVPINSPEPVEYAPQEPERRRDSNTAWKALLVTIGVILALAAGTATVWHFGSSGSGTPTEQVSPKSPDQGVVRKTVPQKKRRLVKVEGERAKVKKQDHKRKNHFRHIPLLPPDVKLDASVGAAAPANKPDMGAEGADQQDTSSDENNSDPEGGGDGAGQ